MQMTATAASVKAGKAMRNRLRLRTPYDVEARLRVLLQVLFSSPKMAIEATLTAALAWSAA
jgi:hypothetical protein